MSLKQRLIGFWRTFKHNVNYKDKYYEKVMTILVLIIVTCLVVLWVIW